MSLYKRGDIWWVRFTSPNGRRIRRSAGTTERKAAQEFHDRLKAATWRVERLGERPRHTWNEAVVKWLKEKTHKASFEKDREILRWLDPYLDGRMLDEITRDDIVDIGMAKAVQASPATANRYLALVRAILRRARDQWEWLDRVPKVELYPIHTRRIRWLTPEQADTLLALLPTHQRHMAAFALATGLRQRNVCRLEWSQVDLRQQLAWIHPDQAKAGRAIGVPLNTDAMAVLRERQGHHERYVFTYRGHPVWQVNTKSWRAAVRKAGLTDFRWHDLRHTWASWHAQAGTPLHVLQELGGWQSPEMVRRYAHLGAGHLLTYAERVTRGPQKRPQSRLQLVK